MGADDRRARPPMPPSAWFVRAESAESAVWAAVRISTSNFHHLAVRAGEASTGVSSDRRDIAGIAMRPLAVRPLLRITLFAFHSLTIIRTINRGEENANAEARALQDDRRVHQREDRARGERQRRTQVGAAPRRPASARALLRPRRR